MYGRVSELWIPCFFHHQSLVSKPTANPNHFRPPAFIFGGTFKKITGIYLRTIFQLCIIDWIPVPSFFLVSSYFIPHQFKWTDVWTFSSLSPYVLGIFTNLDKESLLSDDTVRIDINWRIGQAILLFRHAEPHILPTQINSGIPQMACTNTYDSSI